MRMAIVIVLAFLLFFHMGYHKVLLANEKEMPEESIEEDTPACQGFSQRGTI
jgi:hypothetical protein